MKAFRCSRQERPAVPQRPGRGLLQGVSMAREGTPCLAASVYVVCVLGAEQCLVLSLWWMQGVGLTGSCCLPPLGGRQQRPKQPCQASFLLQGRIHCGGEAPKRKNGSVCVFSLQHSSIRGLKWPLPFFLPLEGHPPLQTRRKGHGKGLFLCHVPPGSSKRQRKEGCSASGSLGWTSGHNARASSIACCLEFLSSMGKKGALCSAVPCKGKLPGREQCLIPVPAAHHLACSPGGGSKRKTSGASPRPVS